MATRASAAGASRPLGRVYKNGAHSNSKLLYLFIPSGVVFSILPGLCLPISYIGHPDTPHPVINSVLFAMFPLGLIFTAIGHRMSRGQWKGVSQQVHTRIALAGLAFALVTARYALIDGEHVRLYPAGVLLVLSLILYASRFLMKFAARERYPWEQNW